MLESFMGPEEFRQGIVNFLKEYKYDNAVTPDLWRHLTKVSTKNLNITRIMDTWTRQMGYPVLDVSANGPTRFLKNKNKNNEFCSSRRSTTSVTA